MDKVLVVGGAGFLGGTITDILKSKNKEFLVYDNLLYERDYRKPANFIFGDITDTKLLKKTIDKYQPTSIIWLAALVGDGACQVNPQVTIKLNQESVKWLSENYDGKIVFLSTCSVYGKGDQLLNEDAPKNPQSLYAITKLRSEEYLKNKDSVIFRLGTLFGISDNHSRIRFDLVVNILSLKAMRGEPLSVFGGEQWRPLLHVRDAAKAIVSASLKESSIPEGVYNLSQKNMTIKEVAEQIALAYKDIENKDIETKFTKLPFEDQRNYRANSNKYDSLENAEKFKITVREGAKEIMKLVKEGRIKDPLDNNFHNAKFVGELFN